MSRAHPTIWWIRRDVRPHDNRALAAALARGGPGVGTDAAPYFRVFSPVLQARKFDPDGAYVRRWIPELARVRGASVHEPWTLSPIEQRAAGCVIGRDYPAPLVEHHMARERALAAYRQARMEAT